MDVLGFDKLIYHHDRIMGIAEDRADFPVHITASLGNFCNHKCRWCTVYATHQDAVRHMDYDRFTAFIKKAAAQGLKSLAYVGNSEPPAYPRFRDLINFVHDLGIEQAMFTNGYLIDRFEDDISRFFTYIRISLDAGTEEVHNEMHQVKGHFPKIIKNIRRLADRKQDGFPTIGVQFATHHLNMHDLDACARVVKEAGAEYLSVKPVFNWGAAVGEFIEPNNLTPEVLDPHVAKLRADHEDRNFKIFYRPYQVQSVAEDRNVLTYDRCVAGFFSLSVYEDERVVCCTPHKVQVGTLSDEPADIVRKISETSKGIDLSKCPPSCRYHPLNELVDTVLNQDRARRFHPNFL